MVVYSKWSMLAKLLRTLGKGLNELRFEYYGGLITFSLRTAIGLRVKDGVVLAVEKLVHSKLLVPEANKRIQTIDRHIGMVRFPPLILDLYSFNYPCRLPLACWLMEDISQIGLEMKHKTSVIRTERRQL